MPKPRTQTGEKNLVSKHLIELRRKSNYSQRDLAYRLQLAGYEFSDLTVLRIERNEIKSEIELTPFALFPHPTGSHRIFSPGGAGYALYGMSGGFGVPKQRLRLYNHLFHCLRPQMDSGTELF